MRLGKNPTRPKTRINATGEDARRLPEHLGRNHPGLLGGPQVQVLRQVLVQNYYWAPAGRLRWRDDDDGSGLPPSAGRIVSPYDPAARYARRGQVTRWTGFLAHVTEACSSDGPNVITDVATMPATSADTEVLPGIHTRPEHRGLRTEPAPGRRRLQLLRDASSVIIAPGYGMAVALAHGPGAELTSRLRERGVDVRFGFHPWPAGRLPGHMNVPPRRGRVPYDIVLEMDEINDDFAATSVVLVIGANDTVNPAAAEDAASPLAGMPVLHDWQAGDVVVFKRVDGSRLRGCAEPPVLPGELPDALR